MEIIECDKGSLKFFKYQDVKKSGKKSPTCEHHIRIVCRKHLQRDSWPWVCTELPDDLVRMFGTFSGWCRVFYVSQEFVDQKNIECPAQSYVSDIDILRCGSNTSSMIKLYTGALHAYCDWIGKEKFDDALIELNMETMARVVFIFIISVIQCIFYGVLLYGAYRLDVCYDSTNNATNVTAEEMMEKARYLNVTMVGTFLLVFFMLELWCISDIHIRHLLCGISRLLRSINPNSQSRCFFQRKKEPTHRYLCSFAKY